MARASFGGSAADFVFRVAAGGLVRATPARLTMWSAETGGTQFTDLLLDGEPVAAIPVGSDGLVPTFEGPDGELAMWADGGGGRTRMVTADGIERAEAAALAAQEAAALAAEISGLTGEDAAVSNLIGTPGTQTKTSLEASYVQFQVDGDQVTLYANGVEL